VNTYAFFSLYANIDGFTHAEPRLPLSERPEIDRWILSALQSLVQSYRESMEAYDVTRAARSVSDFTIDKLSNWYVRRNRRRFWRSERGNDKTAAYQTLYECLVTVAKLTAPFAPFIAEEIYRNLNGVARLEETESIHLSMIPRPDPAAVDLELEERMDLAERIVMLVRAMRVRSNLKVRQPLRRIILPLADEAARAAVHRMEEVILDEINVKSVEFVSDDSGLVIKRARPNFKSIGPKFGKTVQQAAARIKQMTAAEISRLEHDGSVALEAGGTSWTVGQEDVEITREDIQGWLVESDGSLTVALDTTLDEQLLDEGFAREFVNRIQNLRKEAGFEVTDRISVNYTAAPAAAQRLERMREYICREVLADTLVQGRQNGDHTAAVDVNGERVDVVVSRRAGKSS
jgi:isoleucyl-tRNA synthetase